MTACNDNVLRLVDATGGDLRLCGLPPKKKDQSSVTRRQLSDDCIGELLPSHLLVREGLPLTHREHRVQQHHALATPFLEIAALRSRDPEVIPELGEYVPQ